jgi:hypothetical protein
MAAEPWRRRFVHDLLFAIDGSGWHEPELRDAVGFRWSGPGRFSILRVPAPPGAGRAQAQLLVLPEEPMPEIEVYLNGHRLEPVPRRLGPAAVLDLAWDAAAMAGESRAEFWFLTSRTEMVPAPGGRMRRVGFRLSTLTIEPAADGPRSERGLLARILGQRYLDDRLPVATGLARFAFRSEAEARILDVRLEGARLGPTVAPQLGVRLRAGGGGLDAVITLPAMEPMTAALREGAMLDLPAQLGARDRILLARLLAALPQAYARWLDAAMVGAAPDAALLAAWRRDLARLGCAAEAHAARLLDEDPDPFAFDPAAPFGQAPAVSS